MSFGKASSAVRTNQARAAKLPSLEGQEPGGERNLPGDSCKDRHRGDRVPGHLFILPGATNAATLLPQSLWEQ